MDIDQFIGLREAAQLAGVTYETVRKWADIGKIDVAEDPDVLVAMNHGKQGRPHERYYFRDQIEALATTRNRAVVEPDPDVHMTLNAAEKQLGVSPRTLARLRKQHVLDEFIGANSNHVYLLRSDIDKLAQVK